MARFVVLMAHVFLLDLVPGRGQEQGDCKESCLGNFLLRAYWEERGNQHPGRVRPSRKGAKRRRALLNGRWTGLGELRLQGVVERREVI